MQPMTFKEFANAVNAKFNSLSSNRLFIVNVPKEVLWNIYQSAYSDADNPIFRTRKVHECNTCYSFIKRLGPVVAIIDGKLDTIWNIPNLRAPYAQVAEAMHNVVIQSGISGIFLSEERLAGKEFNIEANEAGDIKWEHFYATIPNEFYSTEVASTSGDFNTTASVFKRALEELSISTIQTAIDLCDSIYKGEEFKPTLVKFLEAKQAYETSNKSLFHWDNFAKYPSRIRNTAIGTLLVNLQEGMDIDTAVAKYEVVVAPANYKRTTAVVTPAMQKEALKTINELGIEPSLARRHARLEDISINNVLFANRDSSKLMKGSLANLMAAQTTVTAPKQAIELSIEQFIANVLPSAAKIEALVENKHISNFVSLVAPVNPDAPSILKWNNNFTWSYNGEVTDSMKERVKSAGGSVDGVLRCSLQWNEDKLDSSNDLDLHCIEPNRNEIYFGNKGRVHSSSGMLDVDIQRPGNQVAVENIIYTDLSRMPNGTYRFFVNNFSGRNTKGFRAQIEFDGVIHEFDYPTSVTSDVEIATITLNNGKFTIKSSLKSSQSQKMEWDINTFQYVNVSTIMLSPNFWDNQSIGNKHYFFMLDDCANPSDVRGFYNEFLSNDLTKHRKVFEMLSGLMKCPYDKHQLSGLGFSSTLRNDIHLKVDGKPYKITF